MNDFKDNLREYRKRAGLTQKELADMLYITAQAVSRWEQGITSPDPDMVKKIAELLDITTDRLLLGTVDEVIEDEPQGEVARTTPLPPEKIGTCIKCGLMIAREEAGSFDPLKCKNCVKKEIKAKQVDEFEKAKKNTKLARSTQFAQECTTKKAKKYAIIVGLIGAVISIIFNISFSSFVKISFASVLVNVLFFCYVFASIGFVSIASTWNCMTAFKKFQNQNTGMYCLLLILLGWLMLIYILFLAIVFIIYSFFTFPYFIYKHATALKYVRQSTYKFEAEERAIKRKYNL